MTKLLVLPAFVLGVASLGLSSGALAATYDHPTNPVANSMHATGNVVKDVGDGTLDAAKDVSEGTVDAAHDVGTVGKDAVKDSGEAVKDVGQDVGDVLTGSTGKK